MPEARVLVEVLDPSHFLLLFVYVVLSLLLCLKFKLYVVLFRRDMTKKIKMIVDGR